VLNTIKIGKDIKAAAKYKGGDYYQFLKDVGYASDTEYENKLKHIKI
jgi:flagellum-specific peptidoglycan hydrolase FlgJ